MIGRWKRLGILPGLISFVILLAFVSLYPFSNRPFDYPDDLKIMHGALSEDPKTLDPAEVGDSVSHAVAGNLFALPIHYNYLKRPLQMEPGLAADIGRFGVHDGHGTGGRRRPDLKGRPTFTLHIRRGLRFQSDRCFDPEKKRARTREITAHDFAYSLKRQADPSGKPAGTFLVDNLIYGLKEYRRMLRKVTPPGKSPDLTRELAGIEVPDDHTLRITLLNSNKMIRYFFTNIFSSPVPRECVDYYDGSSDDRPQFRHHPVANGAFRLEKWHEGHSMIFARNENYRPETFPESGDAEDARNGLRTDAGKRLPFLEKVELRIVKQTLTNWLLFLQGYQDASGIPKDVYSQVVFQQKLTEKFKQRGLRLYITPKMVSRYITFNMDDPVVGGYDPRKKMLRRALSLAFDRQDYIDKFNNGRGLIAQSPVPPGMDGSDPEYRNEWVRYDVERARRILRKAGYAGGIDPATGRPLRLRYLSQSHPFLREIANFYFLSFRRLGVELVPEFYDWATLLHKLRKGEFQLAQGGWMADYPEAENFLQLLYSKNITGSATNAARYRNAGYDRLYLELYNATDPAAKRRIVKKMLEILNDDMPWIYTMVDVDYDLVHDWLKNFKVQPLPHGSWRYRSLDLEKRNSYRARYNKPARGWLQLGVVLLGMVYGITYYQKRKRG